MTVVNTVLGSDLPSRMALHYVSQNYHRVNISYYCLVTAYICLDANSMTEKSAFEVLLCLHTAEKWFLKLKLSDFTHQAYELFW